MFQEAATVLGPAPAPPAEIVPGGRREGSVEIGLREEGVALGSPLHGIKQSKVMGSSVSGEPVCCYLNHFMQENGEQKRVPVLI